MALLLFPQNGQPIIHSSTHYNLSFPYLLPEVSCAFLKFFWIHKSATAKQTNIHLLTFTHFTFTLKYQTFCIYLNTSHFYVSMTNHVCFHFKTSRAPQYLNHLGLLRNAESDPIPDLLSQKLHSNTPQVICT